MSVDKYRKIIDDFLQKRRERAEDPGRRIPDEPSDVPIGGVRVIKTAVMVFDIADSEKIRKKIKDERYADWVGLILHPAFHCVNDNDGLVDKYTGDGAMVSFSKGIDRDKCKSALKCSLKLSQIVDSILNPKFESMNLPLVKIRIGIDYGWVRVETVGVRGKTHLVLLGGCANFAKTLEQKGKEQKSSKGTTICFGYDVHYNLPSNLKKSSNGDWLYSRIGALDAHSEMDKSHPYKYYLYTGRY